MKAERMNADLIVTNARVLTMDEARPRAEAVALAGGRILAVGTPGRGRGAGGAGDRVIDAQGAARCCRASSKATCIWCWAGPSWRICNWAGSTGPRRWRPRSATYAAAHPDKPLLMAQGADYGMFGGREITRHDLDAVIADRPIAMTRL